MIGAPARPGSISTRKPFATTCRRCWLAFSSDTSYLDWPLESDLDYHVVRTSMVIIFVCVCGEQDRQPGKRARTKTMATWRNRVARLIRPAFVAYAFSNASAKRDRNSRKAASSFGEYASSTPASIGSTRTLAACSASRPASVMCSSKTFACRR
jgi:hypothetical protein